MSLVLYVADGSNDCRALEGHVPPSVPVVWLNTKAERERAKNGPRYKISKVPSLVYTEPNGDIKVFESSAKIIGILRGVQPETSGRYYAPEPEPEYQEPPPAPKKVYMPDFEGVDTRNSPAKKNVNQPVFDDSVEPEFVDDEPPPARRRGSPRNEPRRSAPRPSKVYQPDFGEIPRSASGGSRGGSGSSRGGSRGSSRAGSSRGARARSDDSEEPRKSKVYQPDFGDVPSSGMKQPRRRRPANQEIIFED